MSRIYQEIPTGHSHRLDVLIGSLCGAALAAVVVYDLVQRISGWLQ